MHTIRFAFLAVALAAFTQIACGGPTFVVQQYDGPVRPRDTLAIIRLAGDQTVRLVALDGESTDVPIADDARLHIEVLPGRHTLTLADEQYPDQPIQRIEFQAEAGRVYRPMFALAPTTAGPTPVARIYEVTDSGDAPVRDVTVALPRSE